MVAIELTASSAVFHVEGMDKLWALRSRLEIPLSHIRGVRADPEIARKWWHGFRVAGAHMPGVISAGTFYQDGQFVFWDVQNADNTIVIDLDHEVYAHLIIEVASPEAAIALVNQGIARPR